MVVVLRLHILANEGLNPFPYSPIPTRHHLKNTHKGLSVERGMHFEREIPMRMKQLVGEASALPPHVQGTR